MRQYLSDLKFILDNGTVRKDRTGTGTIGVFGLNSRYNLRDGFPAVTTKKLFFKGVAHELLWFLRGDTNIRYLVENGVHIWDDNAYAYFKQLCPDYPHSKEGFIEDVLAGKEYFTFRTGEKHLTGNLGPVYGHQWRSWQNTRDQIADVIASIKNDPYSRRHLVTAWDANCIDDVALPPCHYSFQFYVNDGRLSCLFNMRSNDFFLGAPFNIASYALLTHMIAHVCGLEVGDVIASIGDAHIYLNHIEQAKEQLNRAPLGLPTLWLNPNIVNINDFKYEDIKLLNYNSHSAIKGTMAV